MNKNDKSSSQNAAWWRTMNWALRPAQCLISLCGNGYLPHNVSFLRARLKKTADPKLAELFPKPTPYYHRGDMIIKAGMNGGSFPNGLIIARMLVMESGSELQASQLTVGYGMACYNARLIAGDLFLRGGALEIYGSMVLVDRDVTIDSSRRALPLSKAGSLKIITRDSALKAGGAIQADGCLSVRSGSIMKAPRILADGSVMAEEGIISAGTIDSGCQISALGKGAVIEANKMRAPDGFITDRCAIIKGARYERGVPLQRPPSPFNAGGHYNLS